MRLPYSRMIAVLLALACCGIAGIGYFLVADDAIRTALRGNTGQTDSGAASFERFRSGLRDLESAEKRYFQSGESRALASYREAVPAFRSSFAELKRTLEQAGIPAEQSHALDVLVAERIAAADELVNACTRGDAKLIAKLTRKDAGTHISRKLEARLAEAGRMTAAAAGSRSAAVDRNARRSLSSAAMGQVAVFVVLVVLAIVLLLDRSRRKQLETAAADAETCSHLFTIGFNDCFVCRLGIDGTIAQWGKDAEKAEGFSIGDVQGKPFALLFPENESESGTPERLLQEAVAGEKSEHTGLRRRKSGAPYHSRTVVMLLRGSSGNVLGFSVLTRDLSNAKKNEDLVRRLSLTMEQAGYILFITDRDGRVEFANKAVEEITGYSREEFMAGGLALFTNPAQEGQLSALWDAVLAGKTYQAEMTGVRKNGEFIYLDETVTPFRDADGVVTHAVFTAVDLTPLRALRNKVDYLATFDALTGLPNRDLFTDRLGRDAQAKKAGNKGLAVLALDIDRFKYLNEIYGLEAGNKVLKQVAESLSVSVSRGDTVGRLGSDEFGIVLHDITEPADAVLFVKMIMKNVPQIVMSGGEEIAVTLTAGIAMFPSDGTDPATLMKNADTALAKAKAQGRNQFQFYTTDMNAGISELVFMERKLTDALRNKEYVLTFQPYCGMSGRNVAGAEVLLQWTNADFGKVSPAKFIPLLEETGMIIEVGKWVLTNACRQIRDWSDGTAALPIAVNLSPSQFRSEHLLKTVESGIRTYGIDPGRLTLEVTESTFMQDQEFAISVLQQLKKLGVSIAIDDFGTGYSSLSYLKRFPVDYIKIDQSFVKDVASDPDATSLVSSIISMAHSLELKTIAEGVETEEQWNILRLLKCDFGQGYYFSPAVSASAFLNLTAS